MTITVTQLYQLLSKKLNQETAEALTSYIATSVTENVKKEVDKTLIEKAEALTKDIDYNDYPFIALHLQIKHKIWTMDNFLREGLTKKGYGHFFISIEELGKNLYKK